VAALVFAATVLLPATAAQAAPTATHPAGASGSVQVGLDGTPRCVPPDCYYA
jgi:hypothetical protein